MIRYESSLKTVAVVAGGLLLGLHFGTGCGPVEHAGTAEEPREFAITEREEPEAPDTEPRGVETDAPAAEDIGDTDSSPDTVLATVDGQDILLRDLHNVLAGFPEQQRQELKHRRHELLDQMVKEQLLLQKAREVGVHEYESYRQMLEEFRASPAARDIDDAEIREVAMMETLLQEKVIETADIAEEDIKAVFDEYRPMMAEDVGFEQLKPHIEEMLLRQRVEDYLQNLYAEAEIELDEEWIEEQEREAEEHNQQ